MIKAIDNGLIIATNCLKCVKNLPAIFLERKAWMAVINIDGLANLFNFGVSSFLHDSGFMTFLLSGGGAFLFFLVLGDILEMFFRYHLALLLKLDIRDLFGDFGTNIFTLLLRSQERNLTGFGNTVFLTFFLRP